METIESLKAEISQAHHVLDLLAIPRKQSGSGEGVETLTLLGRLRILEQQLHSTTGSIPPRRNA